ncbi:hypothetical protein GCM10023172_28310 [Hymenobacter ginsengisoli]|uniref:Antitoxin VbhA domain-containing protein n=1 Tax=Hymenobacter ginsengisoli TaxID=1051626 RepID=A0ABP8QI55_9BACT|nr:MULTISPECIES: hypothetical protein [unclassified Hymenobacter]MBO2029914.1 hypothetical protein [Hymenobacter sp. BT559]
MTLPYLSAALQFDFAPRSFQSAAEERAYAARLREVENALLCQAVCGSPLPASSRKRLQRYLNGKISRAEAFRALYHPPGRRAN